MIRCLCLMLVSMAVAANDTAPYPQAAWPRALPAELGMDAERLRRLVTRIESGRDYPDQDALLIVRKGYLVLEAYFNGWRPERLHTLQSVSKSLTSAAVGIAIERGDLAALEDPILGYFPDRPDIEHLDDRKRAMSLEDLLTMRSGTDYHEGYSASPHAQLNRLSRGWDRFYLNRPMEAEPGTRYRYDSGGVILISALLRERTGRHADVYMDEHLFKPLGIEHRSWFRNREGHPHTGGGLDLTARDLARFGLLYLREGQWNGRQVVPRGWVQASTRQHLPLTDEGPHIVGYGYLWWILEPDPRGVGVPIYAALGFRGQHILVVPEYDLLVVALANAYGRNQNKAIEFLYEEILPAIIRNP